MGVERGYFVSIVYLIYRFGWRRIVFISICIFVILLEEAYMGSGYVAVMNSYSDELIIPITVKRKEPLISIAVVVMFKKVDDHEQYSDAQNTIECYATYHHYKLYIVDTSANLNFTQWCPQNDFMFHRHCVLSYLLEKWPETWFLFLDADMAVVNPNRLIEEYLPTNPDIHFIFYNRIFNHEIMAGSYLFRNSNYSRQFLRFWGSYEHKLPNSFHGTDNGAVHSAIVEFALPSRDADRIKCEQYWKSSTDYFTLSMYEVCIQLILASSSPLHIDILPKGRVSWARDGWLTNSAWSRKDFILHGWQKRRRDTMGFARWHSPLIEQHFQALCNSTQAGSNWRYKDTFLWSDIAVDKIIFSIINKVDYDFKSIHLKLQRDGVKF